MAYPKNPLEAVRIPLRGFKSCAEASGAENLIFMLCDALPTKKAAALWTTGHRLPQHMIITALLCDIRHDFISRRKGCL